jgi:hypothetical protein
VGGPACEFKETGGFLAKPPSHDWVDRSFDRFDSDWDGSGPSDQDLATLVTRERGTVATGRRRAAAQGGVRRRNHDVELGCSIFHADCAGMKRARRLTNLGHRGGRRSGDDGTRHGGVETVAVRTPSTPFQAMRSSVAKTSDTCGFLTLRRNSGRPSWQREGGGRAVLRRRRG